MADKHRDLAAFRATIGDSVLAKCDRVRWIIGGEHWASDGTYKERLIRDALREVLPSRYKVGEGFIVSERRMNGDDPIEQTGQLDVIVYDDTDMAPIFRDGEFVIVHALTVVCVVEVKSSGGPREIKDAIAGLWAATKVHEETLRHGSKDRIFTSLIAYRGSFASREGRIKQGGMDKMVAVLREHYRSLLTRQYVAGRHRDLSRQHFTSKFERRVPHPAPVVLVAIEGAGWAVVQQFEDTQSLDASHDDLILPVIRSVDTKVKGTDGTVKNHALNFATSNIVEAAMRQIGRDSGTKKTQQRRMAQSRWMQGYHTFGPGFALIRPPPDVQSAFPDIQFPDEER